MGIKVIDNGVIRDSDAVQFADKVLELRKKGDPWKVIDLLVKAWAERAPDEVEAVKINVSEYRDNLTDKRFGQTKGGKDFERRLTLAFPNTLMLLLRTQYDARELPADSKFYKEFAKRYPAFRIPEKL